ncbi:tetratricopeptide repeat protein [Sediminitomix flava]|uniref:Ancillary SecYEG translocon subunit/Cell division coordinator CpoB TPR domain-containing protein n=1 Tax=Sediminitomix flava TaxID=379075 RepID=A0A315Z5D8_SEDFL|nr:tetratricopeptide repeat protein [Sediminitomix flava]PWJ37972.1 hypothetical protein BC781_108107 [Sediminitomix flava]
MKKVIATLIALLTVSLSVFAENNFSVKDIIEEENRYERLKAKVASAEKSDWNTPFKAAKIYILKKKKMSEAYSWLEQSLQAKVTPQNLELKGDYLILHGLEREAFENYKAAIDLLISQGSEDFGQIQRKIQILANTTP